MQNVHSGQWLNEWSILNTRLLGKVHACVFNIAQRNGLGHPPPGLGDSVKKKMLF